MKKALPEPLLKMRDPNRCDHCRLQLHHCICDRVPRLELSTHIVVLMHFSEAWRTSSTANIARLALVHAAIHVRGRPSDPQHSLETLIPPGSPRPVLLFPSEDAVVISREHFPEPISLIVPDGSWRKAKRIPRRVPGLAELPHVVLPPGPPSRYRMRKQSHPGRVSTFEAIARALGVLEGEEVQRELEALFEIFVERLLYEHRGR